MWEGPFLLGGSVLTLAVLVVVQAPDPLERVQLGRLGASSIKTLQFTGSGATFTVGQNFRPHDPARVAGAANCAVIVSATADQDRPGQNRDQEVFGRKPRDSARFARD